MQESKRERCKAKIKEKEKDPGRMDEHEREVYAGKEMEEST